MNRSWPLIASLALVACAFNGSDEDPRELINTPEFEDASLDAATGPSKDDASIDPARVSERIDGGRKDAGPELVDTSSDAATGPSRDDVTIDAVSVSDASERIDGGRKDSGPAVVDSGQGADSCEPQMPAVTCDPVHNTGCALLTQCALVPEEATPTGRCVFWTLALEATCSADLLSDTCDETTTCLDGQCRKPCYCDADCAAGQCCRSDAKLVPGGAIKLCGPC